MKISFLIFIIAFLSAANSYSQNSKKQYLKLPDGIFLELKEGQTAEEGWLRAMNLYPKAFGFVKIPDEKKMDMDWFNSCRNNAVKDARTDAAIGQLVASCKHSAVPKKCRSIGIDKDSMGNEIGEARIQCVEQCAAANYYSKTIGECSKG